MCPNFTCVFTLCPSIFMHNIYLGYEITDVGRGVIFKKITFDYIYPFFFEKTYFKNVSKMSSTKYYFNIPGLLCPKPLVFTGVT